MRLVPTAAALDLFRRGSLALAQVEANGVKVDEKRMDRMESRTRNKIRIREERLKDSDIYRNLQRRFGAKANLNARPQLAQVFFDDLGYEVSSYTKKGKPQLNEEALEAIDHPFVHDFLRWTKFQKVLSTYIEGTKQYILDGILYFNFNLHNVRSFRSSCNSPNFQNLPNRDKELAELVRSWIIPRSKKRRLLELDFKGVEVAAAACYNKDPKLIEDYTVGDMHRDMAAEIFMIPKSQVSKMNRYIGKNMFVFPQFYGDWYQSNCRNIWDAFSLLNLNVDGVPMEQHLLSKGITCRGDCVPDEKPKPGSLEKHLCEIENQFWKKRFKVYDAWKKSWWRDYQKNLGCMTLTGFPIQGDLNRKQAINYPIQGSAFHCLLKCLIELQDWLNENNMRSLIVGQIHDSILLDVVEEEVEAILEKACYIMTTKLREDWTWVNVPITIEAEITEPGCSWFTKEEIPLDKYLAL